MKLFSNLRQIALRLDCSRTTATCSRNGLAIMWISHVSGSKYPRHSCLRRTRNRLNIANLVCFDPGFEYLGIRSMTDSQEETVNCYIHLFFVRFTHPFYQMCTFDTVFTEKTDRVMLEQDRDIRSVQDTFLHDFGCTQIRFADNQIHLILPSWTDKVLLHKPYHHHLQQPPLSYDSKKPSQVAQAETPIPAYFCSSGNPKYLAVAPVEMISDFRLNHIFHRQSSLYREQQTNLSQSQCQRGYQHRNGQPASASLPSVPYR